MAVYSPDRVTRLRLVLALIVVIAVVLAGFAALILAGDEKDRPAGVIAMVLAGVLLGAGGSALKLLGDAGRPAKVATIVTASLAMLAGIALAGTWLSFLLPMIGLGLMFLALLPDEPEARR